MAINFPSSPTPGQIFNASPGLSYIWSGVSWVRAPMSTALPKNFIVNPSMQVSQQNGEVVGSVSGFFPADQWQAAVSGITFNAARSTAGLTRIYMAVTAGKALTASEYLLFIQSIEGQRFAEARWGTSTAVDVVLRFDVYATVAGTYSICVRNAAINRSYVVNYTIPATTWTTIVLPIPGDVTGTWPNDNTIGMQIMWGFANGPNVLAPSAGWYGQSWHGVTGMTNGAATTGNTFYIKDVGFYLDPYKTGVAPRYVQPDYAAELRRCQRYWYKAFGLYGGVANTTTVSRFGMRHPVPMRATPVLAIVGAPKGYDGAVSGPVVATLTSASNAYALETDATFSTATFATGGKQCQMYYISENDYIAVNAR